MYGSINSQWERILEVLIEKKQEKLVDSMDKKCQTILLAKSIFSGQYINTQMTINL
jgi:hypothetical protein